MSIPVHVCPKKVDRQLCRCFSTKKPMYRTLSGTACVCSLVRFPVSLEPLLPPPLPPKFPIQFCPSYSSDHVEPSPSKNASILPSNRPTDRVPPSSVPFSLYSSPSYITARSLNSSSWRSGNGSCQAWAEGGVVNERVVIRIG